MGYTVAAGLAGKARREQGIPLQWSRRAAPLAGSPAPCCSLGKGQAMSASCLTSDPKPPPPACSGQTPSPGEYAMHRKESHPLLSFGGMSDSGCDPWASLSLQDCPPPKGARQEGCQGSEAPPRSDPLPVPAVVTDLCLAALGTDQPLPHSPTSLETPGHGLGSYILRLQVAPSQGPSCQKGEVMSAA